jgi:hypothetical protein
MDLGKLRLDPKKSEEGVWCELDHETSVLIGRINSPHYRQTLREKMMPYVEDIRNDTYGQETQDKVTAETIAAAVLLDWKGLKENGEEVPYSEEKAVEYLSDPALEWFQTRIEELGTRLDLFYEESEEQLKK